MIRVQHGNTRTTASSSQPLESNENGVNLVAKHSFHKGEGECFIRVLAISNLCWVGKQVKKQRTENDEHHNPMANQPTKNRLEKKKWQEYAFLNNFFRWFFVGCSGAGL